MIAKKNPKADLEKKRFAFFQIGLILSGSMVLAAFEFSTAKPDDSLRADLGAPDMGIIDDPIIDIAIEQPKTKYVAAPIIDDVTPTPDPIVDPSPIIDPIPDPDPVIVVDPVGGGSTGGGIVILEEEPLVEFPDIEPSFPGGPAAMGNFINKSIDLPSYIPDYDQGTIFVSFVVNKDGSINNVAIVRGLSTELDNAAIKVVKAMPKWTPGESNGKPVRVRFTLPIKIQLR